MSGLVVRFQSHKRQILQIPSNPRHQPEGLHGAPGADSCELPLRSLSGPNGPESQQLTRVDFFSPAGGKKSAQVVPPRTTLHSETPGARDKKKHNITPETRPHSLRLGEKQTLETGTFVGDFVATPFVRLSDGQTPKRQRLSLLGPRDLLSGTTASYSFPTANSSPHVGRLQVWSRGHMPLLWQHVQDNKNHESANPRRTTSTCPSKPSPSFDQNRTLCRKMPTESLVSPSKDRKRPQARALWVTVRFRKRTFITTWP